MEKKESKERANLKLSFVDLFPSYEEIDENNEGINLAFQNLDLTYNLTELIKNRDEIFIPQQIPNHTTKIFLIKSNNPYASGPFIVKNGEQWVTFSYDHKKKQSSNFALSLIDCIKIKFLCRMDMVPALNTQLTNTEFQTTKNDSILANILSKPSPKKLYSNFTSKKKNNSHNNNTGNMDHDSLRTEESKISKILENISPEIKSNITTNNLNNTTLNSSKNTNNPLLRSENLSEFNPLASSSGVVGKDFKLNEKNKTKNVKKVYNNNLNNNSQNIENKKSNEIVPGNQKKKNNNKNNDNLNKEKKEKNNSSNNITNTIDSKNINDANKSKQNLKRNKSKNLLDSNNNNNVNNKTKTNKKEKHSKSITGNFNNNNNNHELKSKKITKDLSAKNVGPKKTEKQKEKNDLNESKSSSNIINNNNIITNNNVSNNITENNKNEKNVEKTNNNIIENNNNIIETNNNIDKINQNEINTNITNNLINDNYDQNEKNNEQPLEAYNNNEDEMDNLGLDNFSKKLEDFQLLYSDEYIKDIKEEDYSLEIELYIEKLIELITEYHIQIEEKDLEYQLIKSMYNKNIYQYLEINKLYKKLHLIKDDYELKKNNPKPINEEHDKNYINNLITNKIEINMFNFLLYSSKEKEKQGKREQIKKILKNILGKPKHKNIINKNEKIMKWMEVNMEKPVQGKDKGKKKGKQQKTTTTQDNKDKGNKNDKNDKKKKNASNSPSKNKNKSNRNTPEEKDKKNKK